MGRVRGKNESREGEEKTGISGCNGETETRPRHEGFNRSEKTCEDVAFHKAGEDAAEPPARPAPVAPDAPEGTPDCMFDAITGISSHSLLRILRNPVEFAIV